jgi:hypothetical protein
MADKATAENVAADMKPPNYRGAVQIIRGAIEKKIASMATIREAIGEQWDKIEGFRVNKTAARWFKKMDKMEAPERADVMRSFNGLCEAAGWDENEVDLADQANGNVLPMRMAAPAGDAVGDEEDDDDVDDDEETDGADERAPQAEEATNKFLARSRKHLNAGLGVKQPPEAYTGDNSDLNPGGATVQ